MDMNPDQAVPLEEVSKEDLLKCIEWAELHNYEPPKVNIYKNKLIFKFRSRLH